MRAHLRTARGARRALLTAATCVALVATLGCQPSQNELSMIQSVFEGVTPPNVGVGSHDTRSVEVGMKFRAKEDGWILGVRFFKEHANVGTHVTSLWSESGDLLGRTTLDQETPQGWQGKLFDEPVQVAAGETYIASYFAPRGRYSATLNYFDGGRAGDGAVQGLATGDDGANGVFRYGGSPAFPDESWNSTNYWVDPLFIEDGDLRTVVSEAGLTMPGGVTNPPTEPPTTPPTTAAPTTTTTKAPTTTTTKAPTTTTTAAPPPSGGYPSAATTGVPAGVSLTPSGSITVTQAGTVIDGMEIRGTVTVRASNVTIRRSRFVGAGAGYAVLTQSGGNVRIEDSEFIGNFQHAAVAFDNWTCIRCDISGMPADGVKLGSNVLLQDSYLHDFNAGPGAHADGGQVQYGVRNTRVIHNTIVDASNAALFLAPDQGPSTDGPLLVENNLLGGGNYTLFNVDGNNGDYYIRDITIRGNHFLRDYVYGPVRQNVPTAWSNNVWHDTGTPVNP